MSRAASCSIRIDLSGLQRRFSPERLREKQEAFAERVAFEMRDYVPEDQGTLKGSETLASDYASGSIEWATPYAQHVHDLPQSSIRKTKNPNARSHWPEEAKRERMSAWNAFAHKLLEDK
ncbi:minor capsid protein [Olsenella sp. An188]|uniref:minor capsid protein n=1 Tax=Olsenella sp. An188 TaxID=1965579 RepID=UPI0013027D0D|nr:minor capsid protein [Olsenella sp. An188]